MDKYQGCGLCLHHIFMADNEYMCSNEHSKGYGLSTTLDDCCDNFTSKIKYHLLPAKGFFFFFDLENEDIALVY